MEEKVEVTEEVADRVQSDVVHPLTKLSSNEDYVEIDKQASEVLSAEAVRLPEAKKGGGARLYEYCVKAVKSFLPGYQAAGADHEDQRYDTSKWDDAKERDEDYISAKQVAKEVYTDVLKRIPEISGHNYNVCKYRIVTSPDMETTSQTPVIRDYFLKIQIDAPNVEFVIAQVHQSRTKELTLVPNYFKSE